MSVVFVVVPVVAGGWPMVSAAVVAAASALGYQVVRSVEQDLHRQAAGQARAAGAVDLVMEHSEIVGDTLLRGESFVIEREGVTAAFSRDGRGQCVVHLHGEGKSDAELHAIGQELMDRVRQQFAYAKVMEELQARGFEVVQEQVEADRSIRVRVRRWS